MRFVDRLRVPRRWVDAFSGASVAFLGLLCVGAVLLVAAKLQFPGLGSGANPIEILTAVVVLALGALRVPLHVGDVEIVALPLGALAGAGWMISWAAQTAVRDAPLEGTGARIVAGVRLGVAFGVSCALAALVFRFGTSPDPVYAGVPGALVWGSAWGCLFGVAGTLRSTEPLRSVAARAFDRIEAGRAQIGRGVAGGGVAAALALCGAAAALLLWITVALAMGSPRGSFGAGEAVAAAVYLVAFAPNLALALVALGMGAPVDVGARVTVAGSEVGTVREVSLAAWPGGAPAPVFLLVLIPLAACVLGGVFLRSRWPAGTDARIALVAAALTFATVIGVASWLGEARLGAGIVGRGVARVSIHPLATFVAGLAWAGAGGLVGWEGAARLARGRAR